MNHTMKNIYYLLSAFLLFTFTACDGNDTGIPDWPWADHPTEEEPEEPVEANPSIVQLGWSNVDNSYGTLPAYLNVYKSPETLTGKKAIAYIAVGDMNNATFGVLGEKTGLKKPKEFYAGNNRSIVLNGGFFYENSLSLIWRNGTMVCKNNDVTAEDWAEGPFWYPVLASFCEMQDGSFKSMWTYTTLSNTTYWYAEPSPVKSETVPSATFPATGTVLSAKTGIGGGPVLLVNGEIKNTYEEELLSDIGATANRPRSAIGITNDKKLILFVCEGDGMTTGVAGLTTENVANVMKSLGCTDAINLDGGGSSCMLVNGQETIKTSDSSGNERSVASVVTLN